MLIRRSERHAFTLVELLVVCGIIAVLIGLTLPAVLQARESANQTKCAHNLSQLALACHAFETANTRLPPAFGFWPSIDVYGGSSGLGTLFFHLLPWVEEQGLYESARYEPPNDPQQRYYFYKANNVHQRSVALYNCPSDSTVSANGINPATNYSHSNYAGNMLAFGITNSGAITLSPFGEPRLATTFSDGLSQTVLFGEKYSRCRMPNEDYGSGFLDGGCLWASFQADCHNPFFAYYEVYKIDPIDPNAIGPTHADDPRDSRFQVRPHPDRCNPCLLSTPHASMNTAFADASVQKLHPGIDRFAWWALTTPAAGDHAEW